MTLGPLVAFAASARTPESLAGVPEALLRWWLAPWALVPATPEEALLLAVGGGGAVLLAYAAWARAAHRASPAQVRGLAAAGAGFVLMASAAALRARGAGPLGPAASLAGALLVLRASALLVRERRAQRPRGAGSGRGD